MDFSAQAAFIIVNVSSREAAIGRPSVHPQGDNSLETSIYNKDFFFSLPRHDLRKTKNKKDSLSLRA
jgi:hypothetical protein